MKLDCCLTACDLNPLYIDFIPNVIKTWEKIVGIDIKIILIADAIPEKYQNYHSHIILFPPLPDIPTAFQAQCIRLLYPSLLEYSNAVILSDMDLVPLNACYFHNNIKTIPNDYIINYRKDVAGETQYPIGYIAGAPKIWKSLFDINTIEDISIKLKEWYENVTDYQYPTLTSNKSPGSSIGWGTDQKKLYNAINTWKDKRFIELNDHDTQFYRICRDDWLFYNKENLRILLSKKIICDFHMLRPQKVYKNENNSIINFSIQINL